MLSLRRMTDRKNSPKQKIWAKKLRSETSNRPLPILRLKLPKKMVP